MFVIVYSASCMSELTVLWHLMFVHLSAGSYLELLLLLLLGRAAYHYTTAKTIERAWRNTSTSTCVMWLMLTVRVSGVQCSLCTLSNKYLWLAVFWQMVAVMVWLWTRKHVVLGSTTTFPHVWCIYMLWSGMLRAGLGYSEKLFSGLAKRL
jgi:hypothetical protein